MVVVARSRLQKSSSVLLLFAIPQHRTVDRQQKPVCITVKRCISEKSTRSNNNLNMDYYSSWIPPAEVLNSLTNKFAIQKRCTVDRHQKPVYFTEKNVNCKLFI